MRFDASHIHIFPLHSQARIYKYLSLTSSLSIITLRLYCKHHLHSETCLSAQNLNSNYCVCEDAPTVLTCSVAPLSVDARPVSLLLLEETQGPERGGVPCVRAPRRVGGHPGKCPQL